MPTNLFSCALSLLLFGGLLACSAASTIAAEKPNVVFIISDDQAYGDYSFMGHEQIQTPRLDQLAKESVTFTRGYVPASLCRPSLMTMVTGLYPHQHKVSGNDLFQKNNREPLLKHVQRLDTLPKILAKHGYRSHQSGKWWEGNHKLGGFTAGMTQGDPKRGGRHGDLGLKIGRDGLQPIFDFIDESDEPFFLWYAPFLPHTPHNPPQRLLEKYTTKTDSIHVAKYWAMCEWFDETCGELLDYLDKKDLAENTLVIYVTDNGWIQSANSGGYAPRSKRSPNEGGVRTPIMVRWPAEVTTSKIDKDTLVSSIDMVPTALAACGIEVPKDLPGVNLLPVCNGEELKRDTIFGEIFEHDVADADVPAKSLLYRWCIRGDWKLILPVSGKAELYDLGKDPNENKELSAENPEKVKELTAAINGWWKPE
jgi:arylsulfatase A-like enzyme